MRDASRPRSAVTRSIPPRDKRPVRGPQLFRIESPDRFFVRWLGDTSLEQIQVVYALIDPIVEAVGYALILQDQHTRRDHFSTSYGPRVSGPTLAGRARSNGTS